MLGEAGRAHGVRGGRWPEGRITSATVRSKAGAWWLAVRFEGTVPRPLGPPEVHAVGFDACFREDALLVEADGTRVGNPRHYRRAERRLSRRQRRIGREEMRRLKAEREQRSRRQRERWRRHARLARRVRDRRVAHLHAQSRRLIGEAAVVCCEDLALKGMACGCRLGESVHDVGHGELLRQLAYKTAWHGRALVRIGRWFPSSKACSACGRVEAELGRDERRWRCGACGAANACDLNAARNILAERLRALGRGTPEVTRGKIGPLRRGRGLRSEPGRGTANVAATAQAQGLRASKR